MCVCVCVCVCVCLCVSVSVCGKQVPDPWADVGFSSLTRDHHALGGHVMTLAQKSVHRRRIITLLHVHSYHSLKIQNHVRDSDSNKTPEEVYLLSRAPGKNEDRLG